MKDSIQEQYTGYEQPSYDQLREAVRASWDVLLEQSLKDLIKSMHSRYKAVITAGGAHNILVYIRSSSISRISKINIGCWSLQGPPYYGN